MFSSFRPHAILVAMALVAATATGCGYDSERKIVRDAHPEGAPLAPGSPSGLTNGQVDPGATATPTAKTP